MIPRPVFARAPRRVYWEVTRACDLACRHCRAEAAPTPDPAELDTVEGSRLIERLAGFGPPLPHLVLTGGDPLKRPDLFSLIGFARALGFPVSVAPSATPLLTAEAIKRLRAAGVEAISLSLDGSDAARHDALRGVPGCFDRTVAAARAARQVGLPFQVNTLVSRETVADLPAVYEVVKDLGAKRWSLFFLVAVGRGTVLEAISPGECEWLFARLAELPTGEGPVVTTTEAPHFRRVVLQRAHHHLRGPRSPYPLASPAAAARQTPRTPPGADTRRGLRGSEHAHSGAGIRDGNGIMFISHTGEAYPSGFFPLPGGTVRRQDPVAIYRHSPIFRALRRPDLFGGRCGRCEFRGICGGSRARAFAATGDPLGEDPLCAWEPGSSAHPVAAAGGSR